MGYFGSISLIHSILVNLCVWNVIKLRLVRETLISKLMGCYLKREIAVVVRNSMGCCFRDLYFSHLPLNLLIIRKSIERKIAFSHLSPLFVCKLNETP